MTFIQLRSAHPFALAALAAVSALAGSAPSGRAAAARSVAATRAAPPAAPAKNLVEKHLSLSVSGQQRTRYESLDGQFRPGYGRRDAALALRTDLKVAARGRRFGFVGEVEDARAELNDAESVLNTSIVNTLEPIQAYLEWTHRRPGGVRETVRAGRVTLDLGTRRLVARNRYRNTVNFFTGVDWARQAPGGRALRVFYLLPMVRLPSARAALLANDQRLDRPAKDTAFWGAFYTFRTAPAETLDVYGLELDARAPADRGRLTTLGVHLARPPRRGRWDYDFEGAVQRGTSTALVHGGTVAGLAHRAYFVHAETGYTFAFHGSPSLAVLFDEASGDKNPNDQLDERFDTLFGARVFDYGPSGIYGPFARANLETPGLRMTFDPAPRWQAMLGCRAYRLQSATDAWTTAGLRSPSGAAGRSLGRQAEVRLRWSAIPQRLNVETGIAHFTKGAFVARTAPTPALTAPSRYFYAAVTTSF